MMIYVVTNRKLVKDGNIYDKVHEALKCGLKAVILREKDLSYEALYASAERMKLTADKYDARLIVNGNLKAAEKVNAYAYHTSFDIFSAGGGSDKIRNGVSVHSLKEAVLAERNGADYLLCGNVYETPCKIGLKGRGVDYIRNIVRNVNIPVIAIGGINPDNIKDVADTGASGAAVMSSAMKDPMVVKRLMENLI